jgi:hypothetical protein
MARVPVCASKETLDCAGEKRSMLDGLELFARDAADQGADPKRFRHIESILLLAYLGAVESHGDGSHHTERGCTRFCRTTLQRL